jgi:hypothetical protein
MSFFDDAAEDIFDHLADAATYTPVGGSIVSCRAHLVEKTYFQADGLTSQAWTKTKEIEARVAEVGSSIGKGDTFLVNSVTYTVARVLSDDGRFIVVAVK